MTRICIILITAAASSMASATIISTSLFATEADALATLDAGPFFVGEGARTEVSISDNFSIAEDTVAINTVNNGEENPFRLQYNTSNLATFAIDNTSAQIQPNDVPFDTEGFDAILISVYTDVAGVTLTVDELDILVQVNGFEQDSTDDAISVSGVDAEAHLLIVTDWDLSAFNSTLNGTVQLDWTGTSPMNSDAYFTVAPVRTPEPGSLLLLIGGLLAIVRRV